MSILAWELFIWTPRAVGRSGNGNQKRGVFLLRKVNLVTRDPAHLNPLLFHHEECASEAQQSNTKRALYPRVAKITRQTSNEKAKE